MSGLVEPSIALSSTSGLNPTTSLTEFGISMPTTSLPGIGASMRIERAARAIARSSASASMRDTLTWCSGRTSYWVTTGPELTATTLAGIEKLSSFSSIRRLFESWSTPAPTRPAGARLQQVDARQDPVDRVERLLSAVGPSVGDRRRATRAGPVPLPSRGQAGGRAARSAVERAGPDRLADRRLARAAAPARRGCSGRPASSAAETIGTATGALAAARALARPFVWRRLPASAGRASPSPPHRLRRGRADPARRAGDRREQLAQLQVEREHQPEDPRSPRAARTCPGRSAAAPGSRPGSGRSGRHRVRCRTARP